MHLKMCYQKWIIKAKQGIHKALNTTKIAIV